MCLFASQAYVLFRSHEFKVFFFYLASVEGLAKGNALGSDGHVGVLVNDDGRLASEFECERGEVLGCGLHDDLGDHTVASVEDMVPFVLQQLGGFVCSAVDDNVGAAVQVAREELREDLCGVGRDLGGLDHGSASSGDGADHGPDGQEDWVVPWGDDEHGA